MLVLFVGGYFVLGFVLFVVVFLGGGLFLFLGFFFMKRDLGEDYVIYFAICRLFFFPLISQIISLVEFAIHVIQFYFLVTSD